VAGICLREAAAVGTRGLSPVFLVVGFRYLVFNFLSFSSLVRLRDSGGTMPRGETTWLEGKIGALLARGNNSRWFSPEVFVGILVVGSQDYPLRPSAYPYKRRGVRSFPNLPGELRLLHHHQFLGQLEPKEPRHADRSCHSLYDGAL